MAARKQFIRRSAPNAKLLDLLAKASATQVSDEVLAAQRISFAYGNASDAENITKASVTAAAGRIRLLA